MGDAFDTDIARRMPQTRPRHPWDVRPGNTIDTETIDKKTIDREAIDREAIDRRPMRQAVSAHYMDLDYIDEYILPTLDPKAQLVYIKLYRLSHGSEGDITDWIGYTGLAKQCRISHKSVYRAIKDLLRRRLILVAEHHRSKGTKYQIHVPSIDNASIDK